MKDWELAFDDYMHNMKRKDIAAKYGVSENTVKSWKTRHWNKLIKSAPKKKKRGAPIGNKNATGPPRNQHAVKHGFFAKWLPSETAELLGEIGSLDQLEILWQNIQLQYATIIRAQKIMYVKDENDKTIEKIGERNGQTIGEEWEIQQAWDKQARAMAAQSKAMKTLEGMIKTYYDLANKNWDNIDEEQKARIELLKIQAKKLNATIEQDGKGEEDKVTIVNDCPTMNYEEVEDGENN